MEKREPEQTIDELLERVKHLQREMADIPANNFGPWSAKAGEVLPLL